MKILIVAPKTRTVVNFRGDLIRDMVAQGHQVVAVSAEPGYEEEIAALGAHWIHLPMRKDSLSIGHDLAYLRALLRIMRCERPDLVFCYTIKPVIYGSLAARLSGVKQIYPMVTGLGYLFITNSLKIRLLRSLAVTLYRLAFAGTSRVIFQNPDDMQTLLDARALPREKCALVHGSGVNMARFTPTPLPPVLTFFMLARVMGNKGVREYLQAARLVKRQYPQVRCKLLGALGEMADSLPAAEVAEYVTEGVIEYFPETPDVRPHYADCSVYVLPSYREGTPRTVLEAMAAARPIITTDVPGCRETVVDGVSGFLVPAQDAAALAEKMRWFIEHPHAIPQMGHAAHQYCQEKFAIDQVNRQMRDILGY